MHCEEVEKMHIPFSPSEALKPPILFDRGSDRLNMGLWVAPADISLWLWGPDGSGALLKSFK